MDAGAAEIREVGINAYIYLYPLGATPLPVQPQSRSAAGRIDPSGVSSPRCPGFVWLAFVLLIFDLADQLLANIDQGVI